MSGLLLDTSAYSLMAGGHEPAGDLVRAASFVAVTPVVVGELLAGFDRGTRSDWNRARLAAFLAHSSVRVLLVDAGTAERYAAIVNALRNRGRPAPTNDIWIAASAMQHGLPILTADVHFSEIPQIQVRMLQ
jgi:predicted nucleic acid-binding protein